MKLYLIAILSILVGGVLALLSHRRATMASFFGVVGCVAGCAIGLAASVLMLVRRCHEVTLRSDWSIPIGSFHIGVDWLTAFFLLPILALCGLAAFYGADYLHSYRTQKNLGVSWFFYNVLTVSMMLVVMARDAVLFLGAWEIMTVSSFFLVMFHCDQPQVRRAGWTYFVASHIASAFLFIMFMIMATRSGSTNFAAFGKGVGGLASVLFLLALVGFGTKAGLMPMHVWLPEAHPAAPSHVSAVMSGAMIKTGIYGLLRMLEFFGPPPIWWGWTLVIIGAISGILGLLLAMSQHDLKRLLAYSSVENMGIIAIGIGMGLIGASRGDWLVAGLGFAGALLHVLNHSMMKGLLFLGAGSVLHECHTARMDSLGGLMKKMPITGATFAIACAAIAALPPLCGFAGEFSIYAGAFVGASRMAVVDATAMVVVIGAMALIGGLAAACMSKAFGGVFLGEGRSEAIDHAADGKSRMIGPMVVLAVMIVILGLGAPLAMTHLAMPAYCEIFSPAGADISAKLSAQGAMAFSKSGDWLTTITVCSAVFLVILSALIILRRRLLKGRTVGSAGTWDCGYAAPTASMQYTPAGFTHPLTELFARILRMRRKATPPAGLFPKASEFSTHTPDSVNQSVFAPMFVAINAIVMRMRWLQGGRVQIYILYVALTLLILLIWKLG